MECIPYLSYHPGAAQGSPPFMGVENSPWCLLSTCVLGMARNATTKANGVAITTRWWHSRPIAGFPAITASVLADYDHPACLLDPHSHAYLPAWKEADAIKTSVEYLKYWLVHPLRKLHTYKPTGLSREPCGHISLSLSTVPTRTRNVNIRVRIKMQSMIDGTKTSATLVHTTLLGIDIDVSMVGFNIDNITAKKALQDAKDRHARCWQTKEGTYRL